MNTEQIASLKALAEAATTGPWGQPNKRIPYVKSLGRDSYLLHTMPIGDDAKDFHPDTRKRWLADAAYIAACSPEVILSLIASATASEARIAELNGRVAELEAAIAARAPTDISTRLREYAGNPGYSHGDYADTMRIAADECERFHGGMVAWKQTAQNKDRKLGEEMTARINDRIAARVGSLEGAIHYPACWDTAAYPTLADALSAVYDHFKCSECDPAALAGSATPKE